MKAVYYNEHDDFAAAWLLKLIEAGLIPDGDVDTRSIVEVQAADLEGYVQCHFFAGIGGWPHALDLAGWPRDRAVWTGSCPCQPFSLAGKQKGFDDERHLWPVFRNLIAERRPPVVFGEQVASASQWLGLVRGDLEALDYAVGAIPIEAASAGADHLRARYWFVGDDTCQRWGEGWSEHVVRSGRHAPAGNGRTGDDVAYPERRGREESLHRVGRSRRSSREERREQADGFARSRTPSSDMAHHHHQGSQGRSSVPERTDQRPAGANGLADADVAGARERRKQRSRKFRRSGGDQETRNCFCVSDADRERCQERSQCNGRTIPQEQAPRGHDARGSGGSDYEWVVGADGKARRVEPGVRLLVNGFPNRVGLLRGFGNAIDPRPAAAFIQAYLDTEQQRRVA